MKLLPQPLLILILALPTSAAEPSLRVRPQTIDANISIGYGLAIADVDGDGKPDILLADARQIVWYRNPTWEKFVMAENLTPKDNVCIAARDLDGDGKCEVAVGAEWNPNDTVNSGAVFLLEAPADRTQRWTSKKLPHEPTTHRMQWLREADGKFFLAVLPLHGRGNKNNRGEGAQFLGYPWPWRDDSKTFPLFAADAGLHATHNFDLIPGRAESVLVATQEGVRALTPSHELGFNRMRTTQASGEIRAGRAPGGKTYLASVEPMHGNTLAVYDGSISADVSASRTVLDESLIQGHALATGDLLGTGSDQIVVGWRGTGKPGEKVGLKLYALAPSPGSEWKLAALIDDNQMAAEDLKLADLDGDGRPEIIASGRGTKNVMIYWNETGKPRD